MNNKKHTPAIVKLLMFTMLTSFVWVGFEVYRAFTVKPPPVVADEILAPISPNLDSRVLDKLQQRVHIDESEIKDLTIDSSSTRQLPEPSPESTSSANEIEGGEGISE